MASVVIRRAYSNREEDFAAHFVRLIGCEVISRNSRRHGAEVDLLCKKDETKEYFFFEVKKNPKEANAAYPPVSRQQLSRLKKTAQHMQQSADKLLTVRICLLLVDMRRGSVELLTDVA